jgi:hypothetical protein
MSERGAAFALPILSKLFRALTRLFLITHGGGKWSFIPSVANAWGTLSEMLVIPKPLSGDLKIAKVAVKLDGSPTVAMPSRGCGQSVRECEVVDPGMVFLS